MLRIGVTNDRHDSGSDALRWTIALLFGRIAAIHFDEHRIIDIGSKGVLNSFQIGPVSVSCNGTGKIEKSNTLVLALTVLGLFALLACTVIFSFKNSN